MHIPKTSGAFSTPTNPTSTVPMLKNVTGVGKEIYGRHVLVTKKYQQTLRRLNFFGIETPKSQECLSNLTR